MSYDKAYRRRYYLLHAEEEKQFRQQYYRDHPHQDKAYQKRYGRAVRAHMKLAVLSHYGKEGKLQCCWPECVVVDPDMLSLDHIANNGGDHRRKVKGASGCMLYRMLMKEFFPKGYQTLCLNHQFKKELMRLL